MIRILGFINPFSNPKRGFYPRIDHSPFETNKDFRVPPDMSLGPDTFMKHRRVWHTDEGHPWPQFLIIGIQRLVQGLEFNKTPVYPDEHIHVSPYAPTLHLRSIITFKKEHYVCWFVCKRIWYFFDDMENNEFGLVGGHDQLRSFPAVTFNSIALLYSV